MIYTAQTSFTRGALRPELLARPDIEHYGAACKHALNAVSLRYGGMAKRPGTQFAGYAYRQSDDYRLISFEFNEEQTYTLECGSGYIRPWAGFAPVGGVVGTPYNAEMLDHLNVAHSGDVLFVTHSDVRPKKLTRYGHNDWRLEDIDFSLGPFDDQNSEKEQTIRCSHSGLDQHTTLTATGFSFDPSWVGLSILLRTPPTSAGTAWEVEEAYNVGDVVEYRANSYKCITAGTSKNVPPTHTGEVAVQYGDNILWQFLHDGSGVVVIESVNGASATGVVKKTLPDTVKSGTYRWSGPAFGGNNGWPTAVCFYKERLVFGGTAKAPRKVWLSKNGDLFDFRESALSLDDDAIRTGLISGGANRVLWLVENLDYIVAGTAGGPHTIGPRDKNSGLSIKNITTKKHTADGASHVAPIEIGQILLMLGRGGSTIRELFNSFEADGYITPELSTLSDHILDSGIKAWSYAAEPLHIIWMALENGRLAGLTYDRDQKVVGLHDHDLTGKCIAVASVAAGNTDEVSLLVEREHNGIKSTFFEILSEPFNGKNDPWFVDCGLKYEGQPTNHVNGLDHLEGREVAALTDNQQSYFLTVQNGIVRLPDGRQSTRFICGIPYHFELETLPVFFQKQDGTTFGRKKKIAECFFELLDSGPFEISGDGKRWVEVNRMNVSDYVDKTYEYSTGSVKAYPKAGSMDTATLHIRSCTPHPLTVLAYQLGMEIEP